MGVCGIRSKTSSDKILKNYKPHTFSKSPCLEICKPNVPVQSFSSSITNSSENTRVNASSHLLKNGDHFIGESINNKPNGEGKFISSTGLEYNGYWKNGSPHGLGTENYPNGKGQFKGQYENGIKSGSGKVVFEDGSVYEGSFVNDNIEGYGVLTWPDDKIYHGLWKDNKMSGKGRMEWPNGMFYEGQYENDLKHGFGIFYYGKGKKLYAGFWKKGKFHGKGMARNEKGEEIQGVWNEGKLIMRSQERDHLDIETICKEVGLRFFI